ncbi:MAG: hypothetical protein GY794_21790 [bacterium]|nr:hypothetical protein [bacterium]
MLRIDAAWVVRHADVQVRASSAGTLPEFRRAIKQTQYAISKRYENASFSRPLSFLLFLGLERAFELHHALIAERRMAAVALAVRMYQIDNGRRPDTLEQLLPDYLAKIPQDPMDEPGTEIRYVNDPDMPRLYSVGEDGRDGGGDHEDFGENSHDRKDKFFFLNGRPPMPDNESD